MAPLTLAQIEDRLAEVEKAQRDIEMQANMQLARLQGQHEAWTYLREQFLATDTPPADQPPAPSTPPATTGDEDGLALPGEPALLVPPLEEADRPADEGGGEEAPYA